MPKFIVDDTQLPTPVTPPPQLGQFPAPQGSRVGTTCSLNQEAATAWAARTRLQRPESPTYYYWRALPHFHSIRHTLTEHYGWRDVTKPMEMVLYDVAFTLDPPDAQPLDCDGDCLTGGEYDIDCVHAMAGGLSLPSDFRSALRDDGVGRTWENILRFPTELLPAARSSELGLVVNTPCRPLMDAFYLLQCLFPGTFSLFESDDLGHERTYTMRGLPPVSWMEGRCRMALCDIFGVEGFAELVCAAVDADRSTHRLVFPAVRPFVPQSKPLPKAMISTQSKAPRPPTPTSGPTSPVSGPEITLVRAPPSPPTEPPTSTVKAPTPMKLAVRTLVQKASRGHISLSRTAPQPQQADEELESSFSD